MLDAPVSIKSEISRGDQRYTEPTIADGHGHFALSFYQDSNTGQRIYLPQIADIRSDPGFKINETAINPKDRLPDTAKAAIISKLLTSQSSLTDIIHQCLNGDKVIALEQDEIPCPSEITPDFDPKYSITIIGPSNIGKSNLVVQIGKHGLPVHNSDAHNTLEYYLQLSAANIKPPYNEEPRSGPITDNSANSLPVFKDEIEDLINTQHQSSLPVVVDSGGFSPKEEKSRPTNPLTVMAAAQEIIIFVDRNERSSETYEQMMTRNPGLYKYGLRDSCALFIDDNAGNTVEEVGAKTANFIKENLNVFRKYVLNLRHQFASSLLETIVDPDIKEKIVPLITKFSVVHNL